MKKQFFLYALCGLLAVFFGCGNPTGHNTAISGHSAAGNAVNKGNRYGSITMLGLKEMTVVMEYEDGSSREITLDKNGAASYAAQQKLIKRIYQKEGKIEEILIGRQDNESITLQFSGGGSPALTFRTPGRDGYIPLGTYAELRLINTRLDGRYELDADINLLGGCGIQWEPLGEKGFNGILEGRRKNLSGLLVDTTGTAGLFYLNDNNGRLINIRLQGSVKGTGAAGGLCGINRQGYIDYCSFEGTVAGGTAGGICGDSEGSVFRSYNTGSISGDTAGGICGKGWDFTACYNTGAITGRYAMGGICGQLERGGEINACYNTFTVPESSDRSSQICGVIMSQGNIQDCFYTGGTRANVTKRDGSYRFTDKWPDRSLSPVWGLDKRWNDLGQVPNIYPTIGIEPPVQ